ncbi:cardiolipin synthase [Novosphingobium sp. AP12]|uniref:cardiolipin synthase n=1 Tax=Novosphingobium sp. AP12 TaxID=1144305 RepID=UPI000271D89D|nr:cardiolipin synthase [Novosphingobium sp. AP12]EJL31856.1 phosphatidylserine/phosphatidylglycerophosphate/cardiolipin synthase [Novosphingobium sp. AP12]
MTETFLQSGTIYYACEWLIRILMLMVIPLRRTPEATRSWLLLIFFLPIPGLLLYLAIGRPRFPRWRGQRFETAASILSPRLQPLQCVDAPGEAARLAAKLGGFPAVSGNSVELLGDYDGTIDRLIEDIDGARSHVRLLVYIFADDATGSRVAAALARAVERGVAVHVMFDPVGSHRWKKGALAMLAATGAQVREALPFHWLRERTRRDMRNHRKLFLIDGTIGYAGSQNIVDKGFRTGIENRELVARVTGPAVAEMTAVFLSDWFLETEVMLDDGVTIPASTGNAQAQLLPSGANYPLEGFQTLLIGQLHRAVRRVVITSPYFIPDESLLEAMRTAVLRGVEVDLIVSAVVDQPLVSLAQRSYYDDILRAGIRVHLYRDYLLHAKNVSIDGELGIVGSSNVDLRSFQLNEEVSLLLHDRGSIGALETVQAGYITDSDPLSIEAWRKRPRIRKIAENIARLVSPLL